MSLVSEREPLMISYLDLYGFLREDKSVTKNAMVTIEKQETDVLFGLPDIDEDTEKRVLHAMGMDLSEDWEIINCQHRPHCLSSDRENGVIIFGRAYCGFERTDQEWKQFKRKYKL